MDAGSTKECAHEVIVPSHIVIEFLIAAFSFLF